MPGMFDDTRQMTLMLTANSCSRMGEDFSAFADIPAYILDFPYIWLGSPIAKWTISGNRPKYFSFLICHNYLKKLKRYIVRIYILVSNWLFGTRFQSCIAGSLRYRRLSRLVIW